MKSLPCPLSTSLGEGGSGSVTKGCSNSWVADHLWRSSLIRHLQKIKFTLHLHKRSRTVWHSLKLLITHAAGCVHHFHMFVLLGFRGESKVQKDSLPSHNRSHKLHGTSAGLFCMYTTSSNWYFQLLWGVNPVQAWNTWNLGFSNLLTTLNQSPLIHPGGWTTSKSGHSCHCQRYSQWPPAEKTGKGSLLNCLSSPPPPPSTQFVKGLNKTELSHSPYNLHAPKGLLSKNNSTSKSSLLLL